MPIITVPNADYSAAAIDYIQSFMPAALAADLYALYLFGTSFPLDPEHDYSGNSRHLTRTGITALGTLSAPVSQSDYWTTPFTGDELAAAGTANQATLIGITEATSGSALISAQDVNIGTIKHYSLNTSSTVANIVQHRNASALATTIASDAHRGTAPEFLAGTYSSTALNAYRRYKGASQQTAAAAAASAPSTDNRPFRIGALYGSGTGSVVGPGALTMVAFYSRVLTAAEVDTVYTGVYDWLVGRSATFWD